MKKKDNKIK